MTTKANNVRHAIHLESDRLVLRNAQPIDRQFYIDLWNHPEVTKYMGGPRGEEKMAKIFDEVIADPCLREYDLWTLVEKESQHPVGHCGLLEKEVEGQREIEVIYVMDQLAWGKGYATEVCGMLINYGFKEKGLQRIIALIKPENKGSERVAVKNGMSLEKEIIRQENIKMLLYVKEMKV